MTNSGLFAYHKKMKLRNCNLCPLSETAHSVCVKGEGFRRSSALIVSGYPDRTADKQGKTLNSRDRGLLSRALDDAGIEEDTLWITNSVKCHRPGKNAPTKKSINACKEHLEIGKGTRYVLLLGAFPLKAVLGLTGLRKKRGRPLKIDGVSYLPTISLSQIDYDPSLYASFVRDLKQFRALIDGEGDIFGAEDFEYCIIHYTKRKSYRQALKEIAAAEEISIDTETSGLNPVLKDSKINLLQLSTSDRTYIFPLRHRQSKNRKYHKRVIADLKKCMTGKKVIVGNNFKFDWKWLFHVYGWDLKFTHDTALLSWLIDENTHTKSASLEAQAQRVFDVPSWEVDLDIKTGQAGDLYKDLIPYAGQDSFYTLKLLHHYLDVIDEDSLKFHDKVHVPVSFVYGKMELTGIALDYDILDRRIEEFTEQRDKAEKALKRKYADINWKSPAQVGKYLAEDRGLPLPVNSTGYSTGEPVLMYLTDDSCVHLLLKLRKLTKSLEYLVQYAREAVDGRVYTSFRIDGTATGRPSSRDPNLQQVPRDKKIRSSFNAGPKDEWITCEVDFSQIELRLTGEVANERTLINLYELGEDVHTKTALEVLGSVEARQAAKPVNFGLIYGAFAKTLVATAKKDYGVDFTLSEANSIRNKYFETYKDLPTWHRKVIQFVHDTGYVRTITGRKRRLPVCKGKPPASVSWDSRVAHAERQAINFRVQGSAQDVMLCALIEVYRQFEDEIIKDSLRLMLTVHDSIIMGIRKDVYCSDLLDAVRSAMERPKILYKDYGVKFRIPLIVDAKVGNWGEGEEL